MSEVKITQLLSSELAHSLLCSSVCFSLNLSLSETGAMQPFSLVL